MPSEQISYVTGNRYCQTASVTAAIATSSDQPAAAQPRRQLRRRRECQPAPATTNADHRPAARFASGSSATATTPPQTSASSCERSIPSTTTFRSSASKYTCHKPRHDPIQHRTEQQRPYHQHSEVVAHQHQCRRLIAFRYAPLTGPRFVCCSRTSSRQVCQAAIALGDDKSGTADRRNENIVPVTAATSTHVAHEPPSPPVARSLR